MLIDRVITNGHEGMSMEALAGGTRIRPILMTAIATIGALLPLLFGQDSSILISKGMAKNCNRRIDFVYTSYINCCSRNLRNLHKSKLYIMICSLQSFHFSMFTLKGISIKLDNFIGQLTELY